jgi:ABC-type antimicrobial peptide transport system permease subunit
MPHIVAGDYFGVMQIPLLGGRLFDTRDRADAAPVALVSAALAARLWPTSSPVGRLIRMGTAVDSPSLTVIGVVGDARNTLVAENAPNVYLPFAQSPLTYMALLVRGESVAMSVATTVQIAVWQLDRDLPLSDVGPLADVISAQIVGHRFLSGLTGVLSGFALLLALLGLYATISYDVTQRMREFAIRMVVGAHKQEPYRLVLQRGGKLAVIGVAAGALLSALVTRAVATQVPAVRALGVMPQIVLAAGLVLLTAVALLAPARRAARVDAASLLRD